MSTVLKVIGAQMPDRVMRVQESGLYLRAYDPDAAFGHGLFRVSPARADAMVFPDMDAAWTCWCQQSRARPRRDDGEPNRPLTAYTMIAIDMVWPEAGPFRVILNLADGAGETLLRDICAAEAMALMTVLIRGAPYTPGVTRLVIVDREDFITFDWTRADGVVFPTAAELAGR